MQLDDESVVLPDARGALFKLNLRSGASSAIAGTTAGWCTTFATDTIGRPDPTDPKSNENQGGLLASPCRGNGSPGGSPSVLPHGIGDIVGDVVAYAGPTGVIAMRQGR